MLLYLFMNLSASWDVGGQRHAPTALPPGITLYQFHRRLGGPQRRSGRVRKTSLLLGFESRAVHPTELSRPTNNGEFQQ